MGDKSTELNLTDYVVNTFRAGLKVIPVCGSGLEQFIFGPLAEIRMRRIERTLTELVEHYSANPDPNLLSKEEFVNLLEEIIPPLSRATNEEKRQRFRDLLINAAPLASGVEQWDETHLASKLLQEIDAPGLAILAAMARCQKRFPLILASQPVPQIYEKDNFDFNNPQGPDHPLNYEWVVIEEWVRRLREMRLISTETHHGRGGYGGVQLSDLGIFLVKWTMTEESREGI